MLKRLTALGAVLLLAASPAPPTDANPAAGTIFVFEGKGSAHGMGLAMDGVLGQAKAGWDHRRILDGFYTGTQPARASGTIRVGLGSGPEQIFDLPSGGVVSDAPTGGGPGFPITLPPGGRIRVDHDGQRYTVTVSGGVQAAQTEIVPLPTEEPAEPTPDPDPTPAPESDAPPPEPESPGGTSSAARSIWITPHGNPALVRADHSRFRYRGRMEARYDPSNGQIWVINHVDLESYVQGIAEEKGQGWPVEGLKVLAVAARSLGAATMQWYTRHHDRGFDICPSGMCQVYLGYDGEEPAMTRATRETAGQILTHGGRPILAMYHGNGGGQTDSYSLMYTDGRSDPYPYLRAVRYAHANPSSWTASLTATEVKGKLAAAGIGVPGTVERIEVVARGESPRVRRAKIVGSHGEVEVTGLRLRAALDLRSQWFDTRTGVGADPPTDDLDPLLEQPVQAGLGLVPDGRRIRASAPAPPVPVGRPWQLIALAVLCAAGALRLAVPRRG